MENPASGRRIQSIGIGMSVLQIVEREPGLALKDITARAGMPRAKVHLYLATLVATGLLARDAAGRYALGAYALQLGLAAIRQSSVVDVSDEALRQLRDDTQHSVQLSVWGNRGPTVVRKLDGANQGPLSIRVGYVLPLLSSATGQVFTAWLPWPTVEPVIVAEPEFKATSRRALDQLTATTRKAGMASTKSRLNAGYAALSAPVFDHEGDICAAITMLDVAGKLDSVIGHDTSRKLLAATAAIGKRLGSAAAAG